MAGNDAGATKKASRPQKRRPCLFGALVARVGLWVPVEDRDAVLFPRLPPPAYAKSSAETPTFYRVIPFTLGPHTPVSTTRPFPVRGGVPPLLRPPADAVLAAAIVVAVCPAPRPLPVPRAPRLRRPLFREVGPCRPPPFRPHALRRRVRTGPLLRGPRPPCYSAPHFTADLTRKKDPLLPSAVMLAETFPTQVGTFVSKARHHNLTGVKVRVAHFFPHLFPPFARFIRRHRRKSLVREY